MYLCGLLEKDFPGGLLRVRRVEPFSWLVIEMSLRDIQANETNHELAKTFLTPNAQFDRCVFQIIPSDAFPSKRNLPFGRRSLAYRGHLPFNSIWHQ